MYIDFSSFFDQSQRETAGFYPAKSHEKAFLKISDGLEHQHSVFFLRGVKGIGKTHILKRLYRKPISSLKKIWLSAPRPGVDMVMQAFAESYGLRWDPSNPNKLRKRFADDIKNKHTPVLYVDNVTQLDLETVIKLSNILRWRKQPLAKIIFAGVFQLDSALSAFVKKNDIKAMQSKLYPLDEAEIHAYLVQLSRVSGYFGKSPFDKGSIHALKKHTDGIPEKINRLCDFCLFLARTQNHLVMDTALVNKAADDLKKLKLWSLDNEQYQRRQDSGSREQDTEFKLKTSDPESVEVDQEALINQSDTVQSEENKNATDITDEWNAAVNSYLTKHPEDAEISVESSTPAMSRLNPLVLTCLLLTMLVLASWYFFAPEKSLTGLSGLFDSSSKIQKQSEIESNTEALAVDDKPAHKVDDLQSKEQVESALILSVWNNKTGDIRGLLGKGADINTVNHFGQTPLMIASMLGNREIVQLMLDYDADLNFYDNKGLTALMLASRNGQSDIVELLLNVGADINRQDKRGMTALMHAASFGHQRTVEVILKYKPDMNFNNTSGQTAEEIALSLGYHSIADILRAAR